MSNWYWVIFAAGTVLCWGAYGPTIHEGQVALKSPWKAILCVGAAYFVLGVLIPAVIMKVQGEAFSFDPRGTLFASIGGALGAVGAICVVAALRSGGKPLYVMPLIFGGAPIINVLVSSVIHPPKEAASPMLYLGFMLVLVGAGMVLFFKP